MSDVPGCGEVLGQDRISELLARWDDRATQGGPGITDEVYVRAWTKAAAELREAVAGRE